MAHASRGILHTKVMIRVHEVELVCKIPLLARALGLKAEQPLGQERATIGYIVYKS